MAGERDARMGTGTGPPPDWVMCGVPRPDGTVWLIASKDLTRAELAADWPWPRTGPAADVADALAFPLPPVSPQVTLTAGLKGYVIIAAPDYATALRRLFEKWAPGPGDQPQVAGIPQIGA